MSFVTSRAILAILRSRGQKGKSRIVLPPCAPYFRGERSNYISFHSFQLAVGGKRSSQHPDTPTPSTHPHSPNPHPLINRPLNYKPVEVGHNNSLLAREAGTGGLKRFLSLWRSGSKEDNDLIRE